ncbi:fibronectin type III domain-containing protein [Cohnella boryungensis]|uniref:Fibronectin type III domain-containing protein n=1 Tax=Cohnella boryungensis TaxID=768479 RepID=A0ABV8SHT0_9BACL
MAISQYEIFEGQELIAAVSGAMTEYEISGLEPNQQYEVTVKAVDLAGLRSNPSISLTISTLADNQPPSAPILEVTDKKPTSVVLNWTPSTDNIGISRYEIYQNSSLSVSVTESTYSYQMQGLNEGKQYQFAVKAYDSAGNSTLSNTVDVFTSQSITSTNSIEITKAGGNWFSIYLHGNRTLRLTTSNNGGYYNSLYSNPNTSVLKSWASGNITYEPPKSSVHYLYIQNYSPTGTMTVTSEDGSDFDNAYALEMGATANSATNTAPANDSVYYKVNLTAGVKYSFGATAGTGLVVYDSSQTQVAGSETLSVTFTAATSGIHYVQLKTGPTTNSYTLLFSYLMPGPLSVTKTGETWYAVDLKANRTLRLTTSNNGGNYNYLHRMPQTSHLLNWTTGTMSYTPTSGGVYFLKLQNNAPTGTMTVTSEDGSDFDNAYALEMGATANSATNTAPANDSVYYKIYLVAGNKYSLGADRGSEINVYDSSKTIVAAGTPSAFYFVPARTGLYYIHLLTSSLSGSYTLKYENEGLADTIDGSFFDKAYPIDLSNRDVQRSNYSLLAKQSLFFRIDLSSEEALAVKAEGADELVVYDGDYNPIKTSMVPRLVYKAEAAGTYYVSIKQGNVNGSINVFFLWL